MRAGAGSNAYGDDDTVHDTSVACDSGESWCRGKRGCYNYYYNYCYFLLLTTCCLLYYVVVVFFSFFFFYYEQAS